MANPIILGVDLSVPTFNWKTSAGVDNNNSSFPTSNLKNGYPDIVSKSNSTDAGQYLLIDFGSAVSCNALALDGINFSGIADINVKLQTNINDDTTWTDASDITEITQNNNAQLITFFVQTKRYWRILFSSTAPLTAAPQIGNIFLGTRTEFDSTQQWDYVPQMPSHGVVQSEALDGRLRGAITAGGRYNWEMEFKLQSDTILSNWRTLLNIVKNNGIPFYFKDEDGNVWCVLFDANYNPGRAFRYNLNDIVRFKMKTVLANY